MERDLEELEKKQEMERREVEMQKGLQELRAESEIVELRSKKAFEKHQLRLQIEDAEGSIRASSICPSLLSLTLEEDKTSDIKSWLDQGVEDFDKCFSQRASHNVLLYAKPIMRSQFLISEVENGVTVYQEQKHF